MNTTTANADQLTAEWLAKNEIAELRRQYALATDLIGMGETQRKEGRSIYHRIFTSDARISAEGIEPVTGPDAWVEVVEKALTQYVSTQHLIGTQLVTVQALPEASGAGGLATMSSYLQAWHAWESEVYVFLGTYEDRLVSTPGIGWQIAEMHLQRTSDDRRPLSGEDAIPGTGSD